MAYYGEQFRIKYRAWNTTSNTPLAGDSANHSVTLRRDGVDAAFVGTVNDLTGGDYEIVVSSTLAQAYEISARGVSSTTDVYLFFEPPVRTVRLPNVTPGGTGGVAIVDATNGVLTSSQQSLLEDIPTTSEFNARTILAADYFDPSVDTVTVGTNSDKTGYSLSGATSANITSVNGVAVTNIDDFKADVSGLSTLDAAAVRTAIGLATANLDTQLADLPTVSEFNARTLLAADYFDASTDAVNVTKVAGIAVSGVDDFKADTSSLLTSSAYTTSLPANFGLLGINISGHLSRVTLVDTTTTNTDMRGTDSAYTGTPPTASSIATAVWGETTRTLTAFGFSVVASNMVSEPPTEAEIWSYATRELTSAGAGGATAQEVWEYASRTLTASPTDISGLAEKTDLPTNFSTLGINASGHVSRVTLVDTTTVNADMRGTDGANTTTPPTTTSIAAAVWSETSRTLTAFGFSVVASNMVSESPAASEIWQYATRTLTASPTDVSGLAEKTDLPTNFSTLGISASGHVSRVNVVDTTTTNTDMRGTDGAYTGTPLTQADVRTAIGMASANLDTQLEALPDDCAETLLKKDWVGITGEASRSVLNALRFMRNKWVASGSILRVNKEDDATEAWSAALTSSAESERITGVDPD